MKVCRYFLQGNCKFGSRCHNAHILPNNHHPPHSSSSASHAHSNPPVNLSPQEIIANDLTSNRPPWPFSAYGLPGEPSLISDIEVSPEELRWLHKCAPNLYQSECQHLLTLAHHHWTHPPLPSTSVSMSIESMSTDLYASTSTHHSMTMGGPSSPMPISIDPPSPPSFPSTTTPTPFMPSFSSFPSTPSFPVPSQPPPTSSFSSTSTSSVSPSSTPGVILSEEDRRAFEASEFEFGRIPEIEPPEEFR